MVSRLLEIDGNIQQPACVAFLAQLFSKERNERLGRQPGESKSSFCKHEEMNPRFKLSLSVSKADLSSKMLPSKIKQEEQSSGFQLILPSWIVTSFTAQAVDLNGWWLWIFYPTITLSFFFCLNTRWVLFMYQCTSLAPPNHRSLIIRPSTVTSGWSTQGWLKNVHATKYWQFKRKSVLTLPKVFPLLI